MIRKPRIDNFGHVRPPRRTVPVRLAVSIVVLLAISVGAGQWFHRLATSVERYVPPAMPQLAAGNGTTPVAERAVLIIVSGLRDDISHEMPTLENLRRRSAQAQVWVPWPTIPQTTWTTLLSGATPELSGTVKLFTVDAEPHPITVDHLLRRARVLRHTTALAGHQQWESMIPAGALTEVVVSTGGAPEDDARLVQQVVDILTARPPDVMVIQLSQVDTAGHIYGGSSDQYYRAAQRADELIRKLVSAVDLRATVVAITSDHGHLDQGGHGGSEPAVAIAPLVIAGPGVKPGKFGTIDQIDIAPTISALAGLPMPAGSQGTVRFEMLDMGFPLLVEKAVALAEQQVRLSDAYLQAIGRGGASGVPAQTLSVARSAWNINNAQGAFEIARQSDQDARQEMTAGRTVRIADERRERLWGVLGVGAVLLIGLLWLMNLRTAWLLGAGLLAWLGPLGHAGLLAALLDMPAFRWSPAVVGAILASAAATRAWRSGRREHWIIAAVALTAGLLFAATQPGTFSLSAFGSVEAFRVAMARRCIVALLTGGGIALSLAWPNEHSPGSITQTSYWIVFILAASLVLEIAAGYWLLGPTVTWYLPDANLMFWYLALLMQTMLVAGVGILLPAAMVLAVLALHRLQRQRPMRPRTRAPEAERIRL
ncbi:MAG: alkaline phosphatase family protein [Anaerolineae bacterium]